MSCFLKKTSRKNSIFFSSPKKIKINNRSIFWFLFTTLKPFYAPYPKFIGDREIVSSSSSMTTFITFRAPIASLISLLVSPSFDVLWNTYFFIAHFNLETCPNELQNFQRFISLLWKMVIFFLLKLFDERNVSFLLNCLLKSKTQK